MSEESAKPPIIVAEFAKNARETVRIAIEHFKGSAIVSVRVWFRATDGTLRPGRAGLSMSVRHVENLADGLALAEARARALGLIDG